MGISVCEVWTELDDTYCLNIRHQYTEKRIIKYYDIIILYLDVVIMWEGLR